MFGVGSVASEVAKQSPPLYILPQVVSASGGDEPPPSEAQLIGKPLTFTVPGQPDQGNLARAKIFKRS